MFAAAVAIVIVFSVGGDIRSLRSSRFRHCGKRSLNAVADATANIRAALLLQHKKLLSVDGQNSRSANRLLNDRITDHSLV